MRGLAPGGHISEEEGGMTHSASFIEMGWLFVVAELYAA